MSHHNGFSSSPHQRGPGPREIYLPVVKLSHLDIACFHTELLSEDPPSAKIFLQRRTAQIVAATHVYPEIRIELLGYLGSYALEDAERAGRYHPIDLLRQRLCAERGHDFYLEALKSSSLASPGKISPSIGLRSGLARALEIMSERSQESHFGKGHLRSARTLLRQAGDLLESSSSIETQEYSINLFNRGRLAFLLGEKAEGNYFFLQFLAAARDSEDRWITHLHDHVFQVLMNGAVEHRFRHPELYREQICALRLAVEVGRGNKRKSMLDLLECEHRVSEIILGRWPTYWNDGKGKPVSSLSEATQAITSHLQDIGESSLAEQPLRKLAVVTDHALLMVVHAKSFTDCFTALEPVVTAVQHFEMPSDLLGKSIFERACVLTHFRSVLIQMAHQIGKLSPPTTYVWANIDTMSLASPRAFSEHVVHFAEVLADRLDYSPSMFLSSTAEKTVGDIRTHWNERQRSRKL